MLGSGLLTSKRQDWETPQALFDALDAEFGFTCDVCATAGNAKLPTFFSPEDDGLTQEWAGTCWMNPPYGRTISLWMEKAWREWRRGVTVVCLVPARTDTAWWHDYAMKATEIRYIRGRLRFVGGRSNAPFPSAVVIFRAAQSEGEGD